MDSSEGTDGGQGELRARAAATLPIIDISSLSGDVQARARVGRDISAACRDKGFFYISGHGVDAALVRRVFAVCRAFFDLPMAAKIGLDKANSRANRGYERLGGQTLEPGGPADLKEGFYIGEELSADHPRVIAGGFNQGPNQWPVGVDDFAQATGLYFEVMLELAERLMRGLALSLDLPEDHFADFCRDPQATLRLLHYPPQPPDAAAGEKGAGAHTDFGGLTILLQDDLGGPQVRDAASSAWVHAAPVKGTFVVNLGDLIARWTNDRYRSTLHRVVNASGRERYSVPFFYSGNPNHPITCLPNCLATGETPRYPPVTAEAHLRAMYARTYG